MWKVAILILAIINLSLAALNSIEELNDSLNTSIKEDELSSSISTSVIPLIELSSSSSPSSSLAPLPPQLSSSVSSAPSSSSNLEQILEITSPKPLEEPTTSRRRQITYDQRQEGQYNIRADLENFMIVVIPPNPVAGVNLLDLLTRSSSSKRSNSKKVTKKHQLLSKFNRPSSTVKVADSYNNNPMNNYELASRMNQQQSVVPIGGQQNAKFASEFVEGRTPYRVDISSSSSLDQSQPGAQVDVLPPSYPLHLHLMKPYHLEAEPVVVQSPPQSVYNHRQSSSPSSSASSIQNKFLEYFNQYAGGGVGRGRFSKSMKDYPFAVKELLTNRMIINGDNEKHSNQKRHIDDDAYDVESNNYYSHDDHYSPYSVFDSLNDNDFTEYRAQISNFDDILSNGGDELKLIGATEQCGPDGRRDSYGKCHYFPDLYTITD